MELPRCNICGRHMEDGYCINDGEEYYCSLSCLNEVYSDIAFKELHNEGYAYWTTFED